MAQGNHFDVIIIGTGAGGGTLAYAQKPANPRSANPIGPESTYVVPGEDPPMANPPQGPKNDAGEALPSPSHPLLRLAKVTQKRGFSRRFSDSFASGLPAVFQRFSGGFASGLPAVFQRFCQRSPGSFPAVLPVVSRQFSSGFPAVFQRFSSGFLGKFDGGSTTVFRQHASPGSNGEVRRRAARHQRAGSPELRPPEEPGGVRPEGKAGDAGGGDGSLQRGQLEQRHRTGPKRTTRASSPRASARC